MYRQGLFGCLLTTCLLACPVHAGAAVLSSFTAIYQVQHDDTMLGHARFTLSPQGENCYLYHGVAKPEGLAALLAGETVEESHFCVSGGKIRPLSYKTQEAGAKDGSYSLTFDWVNRLVRTNDAVSRKLTGDGVDPLSLQIALRRLLSEAGGNPATQPIDLIVVEDDKDKTYSFRITGHETLATPIGRLDTVRLERSDDSRKKLRLWLAPTLDYLPVQVERQRGKGPITRLKIETLPNSPVD